MTKIEKVMKEKKRVHVIIPTYKPPGTFPDMLKAICEQSYQAERIIIMNTEKKYWNPKWIESISQAEVHHLKRSQFDHGGTRDFAARLSDADILLFLTQDAFPADRYLIANMVNAMQENEVKAAYARQLPKTDASTIERYTRSFNYPDKSRVKTKEDIPILGIKTFFCSNVCAAYDRAYYMDSGGFPTHAIFNEDMIFAGRAIKSGKKVAYAANARVIHSHNYGFRMQFRRNFDLAVSQADYPDVFEGVKSESEGIRLVKDTSRYLLSIKRPWLIFSLIMQSGFKFLGYRFGKNYKRLPKWMIMACTLNKDYWTRKE